MSRSSHIDANCSALGEVIFSQSHPVPQSEASFGSFPSDPSSRFGSRFGGLVKGRSANLKALGRSANLKALGRSANLKALLYLGTAKIWRVVNVKVCKAKGIIHILWQMVVKQGSLKLKQVRVMFLRSQSRGP